MTADVRCTGIRVNRIEHPRGDGLGRALVLDCRAGELTLLFDDPAEVVSLIHDLAGGLAWITERSRDFLAVAKAAAPATTY
jgi:hypothetical protein